jgi:hypothetical protein
MVFSSIEEMVGFFDHSGVGFAALRCLTALYQAIMRGYCQVVDCPTQTLKFAALSPVRSALIPDRLKLAVPQFIDRG